MNEDKVAKILKSFVLALAVGLSAVFAAYSMSPSKKEIITVDNKSLYSDLFGGQYDIHTADGKTFQNKSNTLRKKFSNAIVDADLKSGGTYEVSAYGFNAPVLGLHPNILSVDKVISTPKASR